MRYATLRIPAAVLLAAACATIPVHEPREWSATVAPRGDGEVRANVRVATAPGQTAVSINLAGGEPGGAHPWHIHNGTCASGGSIVGDPAAYPVLRPNSAGAASAIAHVGVQLVPGSSYHVNVHRSAQQLNQIIGCGDLR
jgi:hypothetical protein